MERRIVKRLARWVPGSLFAIVLAIAPASCGRAPLPTRSPDRSGELQPFDARGQASTDEPTVPGQAIVVLKSGAEIKLLPRAPRPRRCRDARGGRKAPLPRGGQVEVRGRIRRRPHARPRRHRSSAEHIGSRRPRAIASRWRSDDGDGFRTASDFEQADRRGPGRGGTRPSGWPRPAAVARSWPSSTPAEIPRIRRSRERWMFRARLLDRHHHGGLEAGRSFPGDPERPGRRP